MGVPPLREKPRGDAVRPHPPSPERDITRCLLTLCCEGACSTRLGEHRGNESKLRAIGYSSYNLRGTETAALTLTHHYYVRSYDSCETRYQIWACAMCGCERVYGAEEL